MGFYENIKKDNLQRIESGCGYSVKLFLTILSGPQVGILLVSVSIMVVKLLEM